MSPDTQALLLFLALVCFIAAAALSASRKAWVTVLSSVGLAFWVLVPLVVAAKA